MTSSNFGAFSAGGSRGRGGRSLASALSPSRAELRETDFGWFLELTPMRAFDALRLWPQFAEGGDPHSLLFDVEWVQAAGGNRSLLGASLDEAAARMNLPVLEPIAGDALVLDPSVQRELVGMIELVHMRSVLVDGPIEHRDAGAMMHAARCGASALTAELRAVAELEVVGDRHVRLGVHRQEHALELVSEHFRHYLAAVRNRPAVEISRPPIWQLDRLLSVSGSISVRPIETEVYSTSIDVGVSTCAGPAVKPADKSLIYDVPSDTWHDEP
jgi:hypothetical protein